MENKGVIAMNKKTQSQNTIDSEEKTIEISELKSMTTKQLRELHLKLIGTPINMNNKPYLLTKLKRLLEQRKNIEPQNNRILGPCKTLKQKGGDVI